jgi:DNA repair exonuclease SbcCD nuclease subunit
LSRTVADNEQARGGDPLFSIVVVADTHINEDEHLSTSPFETNHQANARARYVFEEIAAMDPPPKFVVHLGDIVHPVPGLPTFQDAVTHFKNISSPLKVPLHVIPGNHDVGDKTIDWMPADQVCDDYLTIYREAFGEDFYAFDEGGVRFVMMNSLLLNSGLADEARQRDWLEDQINTAGDLRVFLFMHYPPFIYSDDERGNYDNIDEPGRTWLLSQLRRPEVEAVFAGHVHNFWYDRVGEAEMYMLPSTAFLRHDFAEFGKTDPGFEFGRGDVAKFGYFRVDVMKNGHVAYAVRSMGRKCAPGERPEVRPDPPLAHPKTSGFGQVGVELRHPWAEVMQITATGGVQEFGRKWARNDYPLLALWEMGARLAKVPDVDVLEEEPRSRMKLMSRLGHRYLVTVLGAPRDTLLNRADDDCGIAGYELNLTLDGFRQCREEIRTARERTGSMMYLAKILTDSEAHFDGKTFSHFVKSGFTVDEVEQHRELINDAVSRGELDGVTVRLEIHEPLPAAALRLQALHQETGCHFLLSLKLASSGVATLRDDDRETAQRAAQAMILSRCGPGIRYVFDTFMDVDRGYCPRHAFIDRRFNPRPAAGVFTWLTSRFPGNEPFDLDHSCESTLRFKAGGQQYLLLCGAGDTLSPVLDELPGETGILDLFSGEAIARNDLLEGTRVDPGSRQILLASSP